MKIVQISDAITIELPGLTAVRIDPATRTIAIDGISGISDGQLRPDWFVTDLRDGTYGDFHRLTPGDNCNDSECAASGQHNALYPHFHETIEETGACEQCMDRVADLRYLADV